MKRIKNFLFVIVAIILCIPAHAQNYLTTEEAINIILDYHNITTNMQQVANYLALDADTEIMTREIAVTAVIRSFGVYPANESNYIWMDEEEQNEIYRPYIDYAKRLGITLGVGENYFAPKRPITEQQLRIMLERANGIEPIYPLSYDTPLYKILSADTQYGLSLMPDFLVNNFYAEGRKITATANPIMRNDGISMSEEYVGWIYYEGDVWTAVTIHNHPYYDQAITIIHELGHFLGYRTKLINQNSIPQEQNWMFNFFRDYGNVNNQEFFADAFVVFILWPEELKTNAPTIYTHIAQCLEQMQNMNLYN